MEKFNLIKYKESKIKRINEYETSFSVKPLERGFGNTIGNSIRRVLLSSVSGVAMFAVKIKGAQHEFQTLSNVKDDVVQIILNLKEINFVYNKEVISDEDFLTVTLKAKNGEVRADQLVLPSGVKTVNPTQYITKVEKDGALELEIFIRSGRGFYSFSQNKENLKIWETKLDSKLKSGQLIATDSDYSPIKRVSYSVEKLNTKSVVEEEELILDIETNGSVSAQDALAQAAHILISHLQVIGNVENLKEEVFSEKNESEDVSSSLSLSISSLDLSVRSYNSLKRAGIEKVADLAKMTREEISVINNLGKKSLDEILDKLVELGIRQGDGE